MMYKKNAPKLDTDNSYRLLQQPRLKTGKKSRSVVPKKEKKRSISNVSRNSRLTNKSKSATARKQSQKMNSMDPQN